MRIKSLTPWLKEDVSNHHATPHSYIQCFFFIWHATYNICESTFNSSQITSSSIKLLLEVFSVITYKNRIRQHLKGVHVCFSVSVTLAHFQRKNMFLSERERGCWLPFDGRWFTFDCQTHTILLKKNFSLGGDSPISTLPESP